MKEKRSITISNEVARSIEIKAELEGRSFSNQLERLIIKGLQEEHRVNGNPSDVSSINN